jgi:hypothetical protein
VVSQFAECFRLVMLSGARVPVKPGSAQVEASRKFVLCHAASRSSLPCIFALKAVAAPKGAVSVELPSAAWSRRDPRDGFDSTRAPASRDRSGFAHHDRKEAAIFKLRQPWRCVVVEAFTVFAETKHPVDGIVLL